MSIPAPTRRPPAGAPPDAEPDWAALVAGVLRDPSRLRTVFQPIVDVGGAVVAGYEALARFDGPAGLPPDRWFAAADRLGCGAELEALVVARCLDVRTELPPNCFITVNVSPHLLGRPALADLLLGAGDLSPVVIELTEHQQVADLRPLLDLSEQLRRHGALLALDDAGSGYSGLQQLTRVRPQLIKLDRALVEGAHRDEAKLALAEMLGELAGRLDAWLLAEGVETWEEMDAFCRLGVPLAQGFLLGRPAATFAPLDPAVAARLRGATSRATLVEHLAGLLEPVRSETPGEPVPALSPGEVGLRLDGWRHPVAVLLPVQADDGGPTHRAVPVSLRAPVSADVVAVARRMIARPEHQRFDPVVCVDDVGRAVGVVRAERVIARLSDLVVPS